jgi:ABC-type sugar transport system ATPase subunit
MVGRDIKDMFPKASFQRGEPTLEVRDLEVAHPSLPGEYKVQKTSFKAYKGEILGIAGLMGAGRTELVEGIFGAFPERTRGEVFLDGKKLDIRSPKDAIDNGIALLTEDRKALGLFLTQSVAFNTTISSLQTISSPVLGVINHSQEQQLVRDYVKQLNVKTSTIETVIGTLSGGNQQKVILGKWLNAGPKVFILDEPTRGIDIGAKVEIYKLLNSLVERGVTVIMISSELPEIMGMCDRVMVMCEGRLVSDLPRAAATKEAIMSHATGSA